MRCAWWGRGATRATSSCATAGADRAASRLSGLGGALQPLEQTGEVVGDAVARHGAEEERQRTLHGHLLADLGPAIAGTDSTVEGEMGQWHRVGLDAEIASALDMPQDDRVGSAGLGGHRPGGAGGERAGELHRDDVGIPAGPGRYV